MNNYIFIGAIILLLFFLLRKNNKSLNPNNTVTPSGTVTPAGGSIPSGSSIIDQSNNGSSVFIIDYTSDNLVYGVGNSDLSGAVFLN